MMNFENAQICAGEEKRETAKDLLKDMGAILKTLNDEVRMISDAVYRGGNCNTVDDAPNDPKEMPPMVAIMREQRDSAEYLLKEIVKIREALW